jgi:hypothetical protein
MAYLITNKTKEPITLSLRGTIATVGAGDTILSDIIVPTNPLFKLSKLGQIEMVKLTKPQYEAMLKKAETLNTVECSGVGCDKEDCCAEAVAEPVAEAVAEPVAEAVAEPVAEAVVEPVAEAVAETEETTLVAAEEKPVTKRKKK